MMHHGTPSRSVGGSGPKGPALPANYGPLTDLPPKIFISNRLALRAPTRVDIDHYHRWGSAPTLQEFGCVSINTPPYWYEDNLRKVEQSWGGSFPGIPLFSWLIELKDWYFHPGTPIGFVDMGVLNESALIGGFLIDQNYQRLGYAREAWMVLLDWAKSNQNVQEIHGWHHPDNHASKQLLHSCGMGYLQDTPHKSYFPNRAPASFSHWEACVWKRA